MNELLTTKVTTIDGKHHCRLIHKERGIIDEMACQLKEDIGFCCREMLRWYDKCGGASKMADASRHRGKNHIPKGKIWYRSQIPIG